MRFFRGIVALATALAISICTAYGVSYFALNGNTGSLALSLPVFAPSKLVLQIMLIIYLILAIICITCSVYQRAIRTSIPLWIVNPGLCVAISFSFFYLQYYVFALGMLVVLNAVLIITLNYYVKYTKELFIAVIPMTAVSLYLTAVCFAVIMMNSL